MARVSGSDWTWLHLMYAVGRRTPCQWDLLSTARRSELKRDGLGPDQTLHNVSLVTSSWNCIELRWMKKEVRKRAIQIARGQKLKKRGCRSSKVVAKLCGERRGRQCVGLGGE